jgi:hypothetical protein
MPSIKFERGGPSHVERLHGVDQCLAVDVQVLGEECGAQLTGERSRAVTQATRVLG